MLARITSATVYGIDGLLVQVEVDLSRGLPSFNIVGLPDPAVRESRERVRAAIKNTGFDFPIKRITINLAPADIRKIGPHYDLAIAAGILAAEGYIDSGKLKDYLLAGELSLTGEVRKIKGVLPMALKAREKKLKGVIIPAFNYQEAVLVEDIKVIPVDSLADLITFFKGHISLEGLAEKAWHVFRSREYAASQENRENSIDSGNPGEQRLDFADVKGQQEAKRALEIAAAGRHNILMIGPPGTGKTMLARRLRTILPPLTTEEALELSRIYSIMGILDDLDGLIKERPFRAPHHSVTTAGLVGGGKIPEPGEISLAHLGTLFLDELPEFRREVLEMLRQPLEEGEVTIIRSALSVTYPSHFLLVTAMNPCNCGFFGDSRHECTCTVPQINRYRAKVSGPLLDRIDIHVEVPALSVEEITGKGERGEPSAVIRERVIMAHQLQLARYREEPFNYNSELKGKALRKYCRLDQASQNLLKGAINSLGLSARAYDRILRLARTIADLEWAAENIDEQNNANQRNTSQNLISGGFTGNVENARILVPEINTEHIAEAIQYRSFDQKI